MTIQSNPPADDISARFIREIRTAKIVQPQPGESIGECPYSKTGWAILRADGACTCRPTRAAILRAFARTKE